MNKDSAWETFIKTGSVSDYLKYKQSLNFPTVDCGKEKEDIYSKKCEPYNFKWDNNSR